LEFSVPEQSPCPPFYQCALPHCFVSTFWDACAILLRTLKVWGCLAVFFTPPMGLLFAADFPPVLEGGARPLQSVGLPPKRVSLVTIGCFYDLFSVGGIFSLVQSFFFPSLVEFELFPPPQFFSSPPLQSRFCCCHKTAGGLRVDFSPFLFLGYSGGRSPSTRGFPPALFFFLSGPPPP